MPSTCSHLSHQHLSWRPHDANRHHRLHEFLRIALVVPERIPFHEHVASRVYREGQYTALRYFIMGESETPSMCFQLQFLFSIEISHLSMDILTFLLVIEMGIS